MIVSSIPGASYRYASRLNPKRPPVSQTTFKGRSDHIHGPDCKHHHHSHAHQTEKEAANPVARFFQSIYGWFKEFFQGLWQDLFGKGGQHPKSQPQNSESHTHDGKPCHEHHISTPS